MSDFHGEAEAEPTGGRAGSRKRQEPPSDEDEDEGGSSKEPRLSHGERMQLRLLASVPAMSAPLRDERGRRRAFSLTSSELVEAGLSAIVAGHATLSEPDEARGVIDRQAEQEGQAEVVAEEPEHAQEEHERPLDALTASERSLDGGESVVTLSDVYGVWCATSGRSLWASGPALVGWLSSTGGRRRLFTGRSVLELGSGLGHVGLSLSKLGAARVMLTDLPEQLHLLRQNLAANAFRSDGSRCEVSAAALPWGADVPEPVRSGGTYDLIVASDVVYDIGCLDPLASSLAMLLRAGHPSSQCVLALPDRAEFDEEAHASTPVPDYERFFTLAASRHGLDAQRVGHVGPRDAGCDSSVDIFLVHEQGAAPGDALLSELRAEA